MQRTKYEQWYETLDVGEKRDLAVLVHLYKDGHATLEELLGDPKYMSRLVYDLAKPLIELEYDRLVQNGTWELPGVIDRKGSACQIEDGMWYACYGSPLGVCPKCGHNCNLQSGDLWRHCVVCDGCKVKVLLRSRSDIISQKDVGNPSNSDEEQLPEGHPATYENAESIYATSPFPKEKIDLCLAIEKQKEKIRERRESWGARK